MASKKLIMKTAKRIVLGLIGVLVLAGMFWYINTYIYEFYASTPTVKVDSTTTIAKVTQGNEFDAIIRLANENIETVDLVVTFDSDKLTYLEKVSTTPNNHFKNNPELMKVTNAGKNKKQIRIILLTRQNATRTKNVAVNLKFKAIKSGTATIAVHEDSLISGVDSRNRAISFAEDLTKASQQITIEAPVVENKPPTIEGTLWAASGASRTVQVSATGEDPDSETLSGYVFVDNKKVFETKDVSVSQGTWNFSALAEEVELEQGMTAYIEVFDGINTVRNEDTTLIIGDVEPTDDPDPSPSVTTVPSPSPTPPWINTDYTTTTVYGIVQNTDEEENNIPGQYWRKNDEICANADYNNSATMNVNSNFLDQCQGFNNIPYFLTVVRNPGNNVAYRLENIPEGYECVGWEHRLRIKSDGSPFTANSGTGCNTGPLNITVHNAESSYENSHFMWFKIRQVVEPTPTSVLEQFESVLNMKVKFQAIHEAPREQYRKMVARVQLKGGGQEVKTESVEFTAQEDGTWTGSLGVDGINAVTKYEIFIKGPKHLNKKICVNAPSEQLGGTYRCTDANITLQKGNNDLNFSEIILLAGDLPQQDGIINALDFAFVRQNLGSQGAEDLIRGDLNLDGIIDTQDHTAIKTALDFKYDEE